MDANVARQLQDKMYEKRKAAAHELEKHIRDYNAASDTKRIALIIDHLVELFASPLNPLHVRNGGLIGLAGTAIALLTDIAPYMQRFIDPLLLCFSDAESRIRYFSAECLYNIAKVSKGEILVYFNPIFDGLSKLSADVELSVKNGAELLDRLMKDIVAESASVYVPQYPETSKVAYSHSHTILVPHPALEKEKDKGEEEEETQNLAFSLAHFIPLLSDRIYVVSPFARSFLVSWITVLDSVPELELVRFLPEFLDGLMKYLSDPTQDVKVATENLLADFLREIREITMLQRRYEEKERERKVKEREKEKEEERVTASGGVVEEEEGEKEEGVGVGVGVGMEDGGAGEEHDEDRETGAWSFGQGVRIDHPAIIEILITQLDPSTPEIILQTSLHWLSTYLSFAPSTIVPFTPALIPLILPSLAHHVDGIRVGARGCNKALWEVVRGLESDEEKEEEREKETQGQGQGQAERVVEKEKEKEKEREKEPTGTGLGVGVHPTLITAMKSGIPTPSPPISAPQVQPPTPATSTSIPLPRDRPMTPLTIASGSPVSEKNVLPFPSQPHPHPQSQGKVHSQLRSLTSPMSPTTGLGEHGGHGHGLLLPMMTGASSDSALPTTTTTTSTSIPFPGSASPPLKEKEKDREEEEAGGGGRGGKDPFDYAQMVNALTIQFMGEHEDTRVSALKWLIMLHQKNPKKILAMDDGTFPALLKTLSDSSEEVIKHDLLLLAQISSTSTEAYFRSFMIKLLELFSTDRRLLETRGSLIIRQLCLSLQTERIYRSFAEILEKEDDLEFAGLMIQTLNLILITSPELSDLRKRLKTLETRDGQVLFTSLYRSWCHNAVAAFSLCLLAQAYEHASNLLQIFAELEITVQLLVQIDRLVQLIESPIFTYLRLQLLEPEKHPYLYKCLYGLLMLLPQSTAFGLLRNRLNAVNSMGFAHLGGMTTSVAGRIAVSQVSSTRSKIPGRENTEIKWTDLFHHFRAVQSRHEKARRVSQGLLPSSSMEGDRDTFVAGFLPSSDNVSIGDKGGIGIQSPTRPAVRRLVGTGAVRDSRSNSVVPGGNLKKANGLLGGAFGIGAGGSKAATQQSGAAGRRSSVGVGGTGIK